MEIKPNQIKLNIQTDHQKFLRNYCQITIIPAIIVKPLNQFEMVWQFKNRLKRFLKRRINFLIYWSKKSSLEVKGKQTDNIFKKSDQLAPGDLVLIKPREEIQKTLDQWGELNGCGFMEEMWSFCGTEQRVLKRVDRFLDERDYRIKKARNIVMLEGVNCQGTNDFGRCDRNCFFFWKEDWLVKNTTNERR